MLCFACVEQNSFDWSLFQSQARRHNSWMLGNSENIIPKFLSNDSRNHFQIDERCVCVYNAEVLRDILERVT